LVFTDRICRLIANLAFTAVFLIASASIGGWTKVYAAETPIAVKIGMIRFHTERPPNLSNLEVPPENEGVAGAEMSISDNNTTGKFLGQQFDLEARTANSPEDVLSAFDAMREDGTDFFIIDAPKASLLALADRAKSDNVLFFNISARDDDLRFEACRANILHIAPSRAMMSDALAQFLVRKRWSNWFLVTGERNGDRLFAEAIRRSASKFGAKIVDERTWDFGADARRVAQAEVPVLTQGIDYDVLVVADELGVFGEYLMFRTWDPRPVAGTQGLAPTTWHRTHEQWGSAQLQSRFEKQFKRRMTALDYQAWAPVRAVGEAATRTSSGDFEKISAYLRSDKFQLAGFKGVPLSFRAWNGQLRQPILLAHPASLVSVSPQEGYLHQRTTLDTLGFDNTKRVCDLNR